jgi:hypothetical protein
MPLGVNREESPDNTEQRTSETGDVREGIGTKKKTTASQADAKPAFAKATAGKGEKAG